MVTAPHDHHRIDLWVHRVLKWGMVASFITLVAGLLLYAIDPSGQPEVTLSWAEIVSGLAAGEPLAVVSLGIVLLIITPFTRVLTAMTVFVVDREVRFILVSMLVVGVIGAAILLG